MMVCWCVSRSNKPAGSNQIGASIHICDAVIYGKLCGSGEDANTIGIYHMQVLLRSLTKNSHKQGPWWEEQITTIFIMDKRKPGSFTIISIF
jgi:hypothetical protein